MRHSRLAAIIVLLCSGLPALAASPAVSGPADRTVLADYARSTWRSIAELGDHGPLPADSLRRTGQQWVADGLTSPTNIAAYLWSTLAAEDLQLISAEETQRRVGQTLTALAQLERSHGFFYNWYDPATGERAKLWPGGRDLRPFLSVVDNGWLAAALMLISNTRPEFRSAADALLEPMNFSFFYDPFDPADPVAHPGLLRGGYFPDDETFTGFHYGALNTEPRIASYIGIARRQLPAEHYYRMFRSVQGPPRDKKVALCTYQGVEVNEETLRYREMQLVPTWDGTMFEALMVSLLVPETDWAPGSWGANHPLYVRAQIEYGLQDAQFGYWGLSAAAAPAGGYSAYGVAALGARTHCEHGKQPREAIIAPYASFLALQFAPDEALANLRGLAEHFPVYGNYGFMDSVDVREGQVSDRVLILDQGMILAALDRAIGGDALRRGFCAGAIETTIRPLIAAEHFDSHADPVGRVLIEKSPPDTDRLESLLLPATERTPQPENPRLKREHLIEGIITAAGASAVLALRSRVSKGATPPVLSRW